MEKQIHKIIEDINIYCIKSPFTINDILQAHQKLHSLVTFNQNRKYIAASRPNYTGKINYWAGATELITNEFININQLEKLVIKKGEYISIILKDFKNNIQEITNIFNQLKKTINIDPEGYCVEEILNNDLRCMIRLI